MITEKEPRTWQELQEWTTQILAECGWEANAEVTTKTVRGKVELDVYAIERVEGREYRTVVECKNWTTRIPQNVVHGFRTVLADIGANTGYIVSKAGFQAGAYEAAQNTNVRLVTWQQFQELFEEQWYWTQLTNRVDERLDDLCSYLEPIPAMAHWDEHLTADEIEVLKRLYHQNVPLGALILSLLPFQRMWGKSRARLQLPIGDRAAAYGQLPQALTNCSGYREFLDELEKVGLPLLAEFRKYRDLAFARRDAKLEGKAYT